MRYTLIILSQSQKAAIKLAAKQKGLCAICGCNLAEVDEVHIDHIIPESKGGGEEESNKQLTCAKCNLQKGNKIINLCEWGRKEKIINEIQDPFLKRSRELSHYVEMSLDGPAWVYESKRRYHSIEGAKYGSYRPRAKVSYYEDEVTWAWHKELLLEVASVKIKGSLSGCELDKEFMKGVHVLSSDCIYEAEDSAEGLRSVLYAAFKTDDVRSIWPGLIMIRVSETGIFALYSNIPTSWRGLEGDELDKQYADEVASGWKWTKLSKVDDAVFELLLKMEAVLKAKVIEVGTERAPRHMRRQEARESDSRELDETRVLVIKFRKVEKFGEMQESEGKEWDKSWWVSGHIRRQWYPSLGIHKPKYILPHIKGNPDYDPGSPPRVNVVSR